eukprot:5613008-Lingulodinium_polyedra.AAC.1
MPAQRPTEGAHPSGRQRADQQLAATTRTPMRRYIQPIAKPGLSRLAATPGMPRPRIPYKGRRAARSGMSRHAATPKRQEGEE